MKAEKKQFSNRMGATVGILSVLPGQGHVCTRDKLE